MTSEEDRSSYNATGDWIRDSRTDVSQMLSRVVEDADEVRFIVTDV